MQKLEIISIDVSNFCSKGCHFCYNTSNRNGSTLWQVQEIVDLVSDCVENGVKALSIGGGEPLEYDGIFDLISALNKHLFVSVTSNGLPLKDKSVLAKLLANKPHKIHFTIHYPDKKTEVVYILDLINSLSDSGIKVGVNLLVSASKIEDAKRCYMQLCGRLETSQIILVPQKYEDIPTPQQLAYVASNKPFQSPSCLTECAPSQRFCSISYDRRVGLCSYSSSKLPLQELSYRGLISTLKQIQFTTCIPQI